MTSRPLIVPIGGFLGAGKTSLILAAVRVLASRGVKAAAILNDQGSELVDTRWVRQQGVAADEVTGGCFCCLFSELIEAAERLRVHSAEVIFAEAVGSCTDISATTLQPLKLYHQRQFRLAPYSVLVDPARARNLHADFAFLFDKQLAEADLICFSKSDVHTDFPQLQRAPVRYLSAHSGTGVAAWLDEVMGGGIATGSRILELDYEHYARAEARLAWLNCGVALRLTSALSPASVVGPLLEDLNEALTAGGFQIAHMKVTAESRAGLLKASVTCNGGEPSVQGDLSASPAGMYDLLLNVRAAGQPDQLRRIVEARISGFGAQAEISSMHCFQPSPPEPEYRIPGIEAT
jgi:hypothetical protein